MQLLLKSSSQLTTPSLITAVSRVSFSKMSDLLSLTIFFFKKADLAITFVDWTNHSPDYNMGLWKSVNLVSTGKASLHFPMVDTVLSQNNRMASLNVLVELQNHFSSPVSCRVTCNIFFKEQMEAPISLSDTVSLKGGEKEVAVWFNSSQHSPLTLKNVSSSLLWWPWQMGGQTLHTLELEVEVEGEVSDSLRTNFGVRQVTSQLDENKFRLFKVIEKLKQGYLLFF